MKVLVVCARRYNGHELWTALGVMHENGHDFEVISTALTVEDEVTGQQNFCIRTIEDVSPEEAFETFDALMIVSGNMQDTEAYWKHPRVLSYVDQFGDANKPVAAICCSVPTIRKVAKGKRVSFFPLVRSRQLLTEAGAILSTVAVSVDGKLVTAEHQMASQLWANCFVKVMNGEEADPKLQDSGYMPKGRLRKPIPEVERLKEMKRRGQV